MARKTRSDCTVGTFEKKHGLPPGTTAILMVAIHGATKKSGQSAKNLNGSDYSPLKFKVE